MIVSNSRVYRAYCSVYLFFVSVSLFFLFSGVPAQAVDADGYADTLIAAANEKRLFEDRYWDILVHYKPHYSGKKSFVDDPKFFLSPDGKINPAAELEATIRGFFQSPDLGDEHPQCRFVARFDWIKENLPFDEKLLPNVTCRKYQEALKNIGMKSAVLIFPVAYGNGPASMFGHTLIRIDSTYESELLSYAINYAAHAENVNGFVYVFNGLFGFFKGYYSVLPYYEKVKEYNYLEHRDIWEYYLNLSEVEIRRMVLHIWELRDIYSDYYFFDENCSYNLLFLLEAARPSAELTDYFLDRMRFWVIPSDTVRVVIDGGFVRDVKYRPSLATRIQFFASRSSMEDQKVTLRVTNRELDARQIADMDLTNDAKINILDAAAELVQYRYSRREMSKEEYQKQFLAVLNTRSTLGKPDADISILLSPPMPPEKGHLPGKFAIIGGWRSLGAREWFTELEWRPAYHDLMDPDEGYVEGAQINFFDVRGRYYPDDGSLKLQSLRLLDILSLAPRDLFFKPVSWKVTTGFDRAIMRDGSDHLIYRVNPGGGAAYKNILGLSYIMLESDIKFSNVLVDRFALGIGPSSGIYWNITDAWKLNLAVSALFYPLGDTHRSYKGSIRQSFEINTSNTIEFTAAWEKTFSHNLTDMRLGWNIFF